MWPDPKGPNNIYGNIGSGIEMKPVLEFTFNIYCNKGPGNSRKPVLSSAVLLTSNVYFLVCALPCTHYIEGWRKFSLVPLIFPFKVYGTAGPENLKWGRQLPVFWNWILPAYFCVRFQQGQRLFWSTPVQFHGLHFILFLPVFPTVEIEDHG